MLDNSLVDGDIEYIYRWTSPLELSQMNGSYPTWPNVTLAPYPEEDGNYTCYADTDNQYTKESDGNTTTIEVLSKLWTTQDNKTLVAYCKS